MPKQFPNVKVPLDEELADHLQWLMPGYSNYRILKQSVDARQRHNPHFVYSLEVAAPGEILETPTFDLAKAPWTGDRPIIVGTGPAGLFAALRFVERGIPCVLLERGSPANERMKGISGFWRHGVLDKRNNVCFGEGGAGLYSDGKLITRIKSPHIPYVMNRLVKFGAPEEIQWLANPHVGSDRIRRVIPVMREYLIQHGCEIRFNTTVTELLYEGKTVVGVKTEYGDLLRGSAVILATGHSAEDILYHLRDAGVKLEGKSFAMGLRVEHPQALINSIQYREAADHPKLGSANYRLAHHDAQSEIGVYSFCMCPGGYVLSSGTEEDRLVSNGMSNYHRNSPFANAAIVISVDHNSLFGGDVFGGMKLREQLEREAHRAVLAAGGSKELPAQKMFHFLEQTLGPVEKGSSPSGSIAVRLDQILPSWMREKLQLALQKFDQQMKGFLHEEAKFYGIESRTSCPIRVTRDPDTLESVSHENLYPAGEGAGYAGGITSAACDGIRIAEKWIEKFTSSAPATSAERKQL